MLTIVYGTRPEAVKLGPVAAELRALGISFKIVSTSQHSDLLRGTPAESDLENAKHLGLLSDGSPLRWVMRSVAPIARALHDASLVVVQGDTMTAMAATRAAAALSKPVAHVEAGVRSGSDAEPWPEEGFRREISQRAAWHFAPTARCVANLRAEGIPPEAIFETGNSVVSAMTRYAGVRPSPPSPRAYALLTMHRREWREVVDFEQWVQALAEAAAEHPKLEIVWPVHPGVAPRIPQATLPPNVRLTTPLPYNAMLAMLAGATGVITDSGGLTEEAATLGVPTAIMRRFNDRPEAESEGCARRFDPTPETLRDVLNVIATGALGRRPSDCFGTPEAASRIARHLTTLAR